MLANVCFSFLRNYNRESFVNGRNSGASVLSSLKRIKTNVIGVVLNEVREDMSDRYYYYGYYGKYYSKYYKTTKN